MQFTGNYKLKKPDGTDIVNINDLNDNADIVDTELKKLSNHVVDKSNPHGITPTQIGAITSLELNNHVEKVASLDNINADPTHVSEYMATIWEEHRLRKDNPHNVTRKHLELDGAIAIDGLSRFMIRLRDDATVNALQAGGANPQIVEMTIPIPNKAKRIIICWSYSLWEYYYLVGAKITLAGVDIAHVTRGGGEPGEGDSGAPAYFGKDNEIVTTSLGDLAGTNQVLKLEVYGDSSQASIKYVEYDIPIAIRY